MRAVCVHHTVISLGLATWDERRHSQCRVVVVKFNRVANQHEHYKHLVTLVCLSRVSVRVLSVVCKVNTLSIIAVSAVPHI